MGDPLRQRRTAAGSTAAIRAAGGRPIQAGSGRLQFAVREPGPCGGAESYRMPTVTLGFIEQGETIAIRSRSTAPSGSSRPSRSRQ